MRPPKSVTCAAEGFSVHLGNFDGPFDLLLTLIAKRELDITEVALAQVTDEFLDRVRAVGQHEDLDQTSSFLVVAATLLDLKATRLLPGVDLEDEEDLAVLEARDLLFARLLQYRAYKQVAAQLGDRLAGESGRFPRSVGLDDRFTALLPQVLVGLGPGELAALAARALAPRPAPTIALGHLHAPQVSVREEAMTVAARLRRVGTATFRSLSADSATSLTTVARFLALLELYRDGVVAFEQLSPLGELTVRWTGAADGDVDISGEFGADHRDPGEDSQ